MTKEQILSRWQMQCSRREYSVGQVRDRLMRFVFLGDFERKDADWIIDSLIEDKFLDDSRFACAYVREKYRLSGWGKRKIEYHLSKLGVVSSVIESAVKENYNVLDENSDMLKKIMERKFNSIKKDEPVTQKKLKVLRFALGRGFEYGDIMDILRNIEQ